MGVWDWSWLKEGVEVYILSMIDEEAGEPILGTIVGLVYLAGGLPNRPEASVIIECRVNVGGVPFMIAPNNLSPAG